MRAVLILLAALASAPAASAQPIERAEAEALFREANRLFHQGNQSAETDSARAYELYRGAALRYERLIREGEIRNGRLYYNLGNARFQMNDLGRAILNYRRAARLLPGDDNIERNLEYARTRRLDRFDEMVETRVLKTLLFWHYDLSARVRTALFALFWAGLWCAAAVRLFRRELIPGLLPAVLGLGAAMFFGSIAAEQTPASGEAFGVVVAEETVARRGDGESYQPAFTEPLHAGVEFRLLEDRPGWRDVELPDGRTCWIRADDSELADEL
jgi:hypothetical protein